MDREYKIKWDGKFLRNGQATPLLRKDVNLSLESLEKIAQTVLRTKGGRPSSFGIRDAYVVGSVLNGSTKSDIDIYYRTEGTDVSTNNILKLNLFYVLCEGKDKSDWIDVYFGTDLPGTGTHEGRPIYRITNQFKTELKRYNHNIGALEIKLGH